MKQIPVLLVLGFALTFCNLSNKLKTTTKPGEPSKTGSTSSDTGPAERPNPTAAQTAALAGGQTLQWDQQGMSWTVPPKWKESSKESKMLVWRSPGSWDAASMIVNISALDESFPMDSATQASYDSAKTRLKNGEVDEVKWLEIDGLKGVEFREANPEKPDGIRRLQWMGYRKYAGQVQLVNLILSSSGKGFPTHEDEIYGVLYSMKIVH